MNIDVVWCAHCRSDYDRGEFVVKRRDRRRLATGERVLSATHRRCRGDTEYPDVAGQPLMRRGTMSAASR